MKPEQYQRRLQPAIDLVIDLFIENEKKYGEGIKLDKQDILKAAGHAISAARGLNNPDGQSHSVAAASRALKAVLGELE
jgi:hypothetical protein